MSIADTLANQRQWHIEETDVRAGLRSMPDESVHCVVTSPPYWGLRAYGTEPQIWGQCDQAGLAQYGCIPMSMEHVWGDSIPGDPRGGSGTFNGRNGNGEGYARSDPKGNICIRCGAWRGELGGEPTIALYVEHLVEVFCQVRRVLRKDGTCWLNIGDSYAGSGRGQGLKPKDLCLIPERLAIALQDDGWWVRSRIAWCKTSAMPESVTDRPTSAWEHVWLLTKSARYYYDADAVRTPSADSTVQRLGQDVASQNGSLRANGGAKTNGPLRAVGDVGSGANIRNYWVLGPEPFNLAHFATFPPELARRCILAGTSERGCCSECGAPWRRVCDVQKSQGLAPANIPVGGREDGYSQPRWAAGEERIPPSRITVGWEPTCKHDTDPIPSLILDPFSGAGTVAMVALRHGRRAIGFDLNPEYVQMARRRIEQDAPLFNTVPS